MAYSRLNSQTNSWFTEQTDFINSASEKDLRNSLDDFDLHLESVVENIAKSYKGLNVFRDAKRMLDNPVVMESYKQELLNPILDEMREYEGDEVTKIHLEQVADQLEEAWDQSKKSFLVQESFNTSTYLPLSTLDFPALIKGYIRFLGKELIPVQTATSTNIEQRIFTKYLVNNQTGDEIEVPRLYFHTDDEDPHAEWKKMFNAGKGYRFNPNKPILFASFTSTADMKLSLLDKAYLIDEAGASMATGTWAAGKRDRLSYDFNIEYVKYTVGSTSYKVQLPKRGIQIDIATGGNFFGGVIAKGTVLTGYAITATDANGTETYSATPTKFIAGSAASTGYADGTNLVDRVSGAVDFVKGTVTASKCGSGLVGFYVNGYISNENNMRTIGFREYPEIRKFLISDGCRFQLPFTVEDFAEASTIGNFNLYNRLTQELITNQELFEDEYILSFLDDEFAKFDGYESDVWALDSYTHTEKADLDPTSLNATFAGDPWEFRTNAIHNAIQSVIYELCDKGKLDNLGFVIYCNPKCARLLKKFVTWTVQKNTTIGGVQMNHSFGIMTDEEVPIRVVASNRVSAYTKVVESTTNDNNTTTTTTSLEYFYKIIAYPMDKNHIGYKHLRFARHLTNSPENAAYADAQNPGGAAVLITTSSQYRTIAVQGIQGRVVCRNTYLVPDAKAAKTTVTA